MFFSCFSIVFVFERTRPAARIRPPCLIYIFTTAGVRTGLQFLIGLSAVCVTIVLLTVSVRVHEAYFHEPRVYRSEHVWANAWYVCVAAHAVSRCRGRRAAVDCGV